ncbi:MAG: hypothetical protein J3K34DRAFT_489495 [Monoraphidium minutum]|nr:MAG: hypothetical protein J3K34DRAFT_489495 [Monoraphidium minutum]
MQGADAADAHAADEDHWEPPAWQQFHKGYRERFVLDCDIKLLSNGATVRVAQAPSAKRDAPPPGKQQRAARQAQQAPQQAPQPKGRGAAVARGRGRAAAAAGGRSGRGGAPAAVAGGGRGGGGGGGGGAGAEAQVLDRVNDPALTGSTVWDGAIVLGQFLTSDPAALAPPRGAARWPSGRVRPVVLELGAGTGAVSLCLLAARAVEGVVLTDIPDMLPHLQRNVVHNSAVANPAQTLVASLRWSDAADAATGAEVPPQPAGQQGQEAAAAPQPSEQRQEQQAAQQQAGAAEQQQQPSAWRPPWDVVCGSDLIYYTYSAETPHSRLLLAALRALCCGDTRIFLSLSLHHNPDEVERFLEWAAGGGFAVARVPQGRIPREYRVPDVLVVELCLKGGGGGGEEAAAGVARLALACLLTLFETSWFGSPAGSAVTAAGLAKAWYASAAATGSTPSLYCPDEDDLPGGVPPALLPEPPRADPPRRAAAPAPPRPLSAFAAAAAAGGSAPAARRPLAGPHWQEEPYHLTPHLRQLELEEERRRSQQRAAADAAEVEAEGARRAAAAAASPQGAPVPIRGGGGEAGAEAEAGGRPAALGTWAGRQFKLPLPWRSGGGAAATAAGSAGSGQQQQGGAKQQQQQQQQQHQEEEEEQEQQQTEQQQGAGQRGGAQPQHPRAAPEAVPEGEGGEEEEESEEEEQMARAAWRWRFAKRWQAEQARQLDPAASAGDGDGMEETLEYLAACGQPWDMPARGGGGGGAAGGSCVRSGSGLGGTVGSVGLLGQEALLVGDLSRNASLSSPPSGRRGSLLSAGGGSGRARAAAGSVGGRGGGGGGSGAATRELTAVTRRATALLQAQSDLDKAAGERWREAQAPAGGGLWVGALLEAVEIDGWGKFVFVLARVRGRGGRQKLLVRGANYASEAKLVEGLTRQLLAAAAANGVPSEAVEVVGGGVMEWRRDRDRALHLHSGHAAAARAGGGGAMAPREVLNLAGVLTKQSLPIHYKVTTEGGKAL